MEDKFSEKENCIIELSNQLEQERLCHASQTSEDHKEIYGQYFTPYKIADFMSSLFPKTDKKIKLLDPGAGIGILACSFMCRILRENWQIPSIRISAYDIDKDVHPTLNDNIAKSVSSFKESCYEIFTEDFMEKAAFNYKWNANETYTHVIMNPPYKKILKNSKERYYARAFGLETVNLYSAFMGAAISFTEDNGYIVAIVPRSFCNGVYYKPFREFILKNCAINHIHLFESRNKAFKEESVLQENIIIMLQKSAAQQDIRISYCNDDSFTDFSEFNVPFSNVLQKNDHEKFFNIPTKQQIENESSAKYSKLKDLNIKVSTGPVVDFRVKDLLLNDCRKNSCPLIYPIHLRKHRLSWPQESKKPNAILISDEVKNILFPKGFYVLVKRFSTKEEKKRIVASLITPMDFTSDNMTFENHLNIFHTNKNSLSENIAYGLVCWLNSTYIDEKFRLFSGHTQVNATDLNNLPYPDLENLSEIGKKLKNEKEWSQTAFDNLAREIKNEN